MSINTDKHSDLREKLSGTMRIDIQPESQEVSSGAGKAGRRIITKVKKAVPGQRPTPAAPQAADVLGNKDFQSLFQSVYDGAIITDMEGNVVDANVRACQFLLYSADEFRTLSILNIISGAEASLIEMIRKTLVDRFLLIEACYCARKDGTFFPAEIAVNQIQFAQQDFLCFFVRDVSLRRQAEEQLRVVSNAVANSSSGIAITDLDGVIQYVNPAICRMWQGDESGIVGRDIRSLWRKTEVDDTLQQSITSLSEAWMREMTACRKDESEFDVQVIAAANRDTDGKLVGMVFSFVDISDRKRAEDAMREAERQRVMLESLGAACHHLGQPATVLLANLGIMERKIGPENAGLNTIVQSCVTAAESLSEILHKLNAINEYRTTPYLEESAGSPGSRILDI